MYLNHKYKFFKALMQIHVCGSFTVLKVLFPFSLLPLLLVQFLFNVLSKREPLCTFMLIL